VLPVSNYGHDGQGHPIDMRINRPPEKILELNDGLRPNAKGYAVMAPLAEQAIREALKKKR
jgi:lysophospholipase L1-like esterase